MATTLKTKNSVTAASAPSSLAQGELAVNITDKKLWVGNAATTPVQLLGAGVTGDVVGPASATDNALARFDLTTGKLIQNSVGILSDAGALTGITDFTYTGTLTGGTGVVNLGSGQFYKDASGNVGIGTTTPSALGSSLTEFTVKATTADKYGAINLIGVRDVGGNQNGVISFWNNFSTLTRTAYIQGTNTASSNTAGELSFVTKSSAGALTEQLRINSTGALALQGASTSASGVGITFPATQSASSDANTLDDYEEGTWTPTCTTTGITSVTTGGKYTKIGNMVYLVGFVSITNAGTASGQMAVSNLPFSYYTSGGSIQGTGVCRESGTTGLEYYFNTQGNATTFFINSATNGAVIWINGYTYTFSMTYQTAT